MTPKPPPSLVRYLREGRCVLFCGSGLSAWAKLPTWSTLLENIVQQLGDELPDNTDSSELKSLLQKGKLLEVADHCKEALGRRYNEILSENLRGDAGDIPEPHKVIVQLPFSAIVTTNYDKLLERSYSSVGNLPKSPTHSDVDALGPLLFDRSFFILKAHGDIDRPESMVLTTRDYQEIIHANPAFNSIFSAILLTKAVFFVGYSINDPDFRLLLDRQLTVFKGNIPDRYALMSGVGRVERDVLWRTARIRVIAYEDQQHGQVLDFLKELLVQTGGKEQPVAPPAPIAPVLSSQTRDAKAPVPPVTVVSAPAAAPAPGRTPAPGPSLHIRLRGSVLEASVSSNGTVIQGTGSAPDWPRLTMLLKRVDSSATLPHHVGEELSKCLSESVRVALKSVAVDQVITLRLSAELELLPWEWLLVDGSFLMLRNAIVRAPIGVSDSARGYPQVGQPPRILLIGDPNRDDYAALPGAAEEVQKISSVYRDQAGIEPTMLIGSEANFERLVTEFSTTQYDIVHFAGHAWFDELEPYLLLSGQVKLRSTELRSLLSERPPAILVLNSHFTIFTPPGASGGESVFKNSEAAKPNLQGQRGFIEAATSSGVGALIGCFSGSLNDATASGVGVRLHAALVNGVPVAQALHEALVDGDPAQAELDSSRLFYAMSGYGDIALPRMVTADSPPKKTKRRSK